ncbi:unnamed protein product, partial [Amoebophrya sp. A120]
YHSVSSGRWAALCCSFFVALRTNSCFCAGKGNESTREKPQRLNRLNTFRR